MFPGYVSQNTSSLEGSASYLRYSFVNRYALGVDLARRFQIMGIGKSISTAFSSLERFPRPMCVQYDIV